jgi:Ca-activated chloride channel family protein
MTAMWPGFLALLLLIPLLIAAYIWMLRRRRRFAVRYSSLSLVREALPRSNWRRHIPFALFLLALTSLILALVRPLAIVSVPTNQTTIILALDVSRSMCSTDITPNRLVAAKDAAVSFVQQQRDGTRIGVVAFAGYAELIQPPTTDDELLEEAIDGLLTGSRTAIGSGILRSIDAIAEIDPNVPRSTSAGSSAPTPTPVPKGTYAPDIIVLLTDGASNSGPTPLNAAKQAADRGIRVYTIGFGTARGSEMPNCNPGVTGREPNSGLPSFGGGGGAGFGGGGFRRGIDEETLKRVSALTDGKYYSAESASELTDVFNSLPTSLITKTETTEISVAFAALGALLAAIAVTMSLLRHPLP